MVNVDTVYQRVLALANKEQRGYITPQEFNLFANQAQMDIFEQYFYDINQFRRLPGNDSTHADPIDILEEKLNIFKETWTAPNNNLAYTYSLPEDYYRIDHLQLINHPDGQNREIEKISHKEKLSKSISPLLSATNERPSYFMKGNEITIQTKNILPRVKIVYIRTPNFGNNTNPKVEWNGTIINNTPQYNSGPSVDFELHVSEESKLVIKILTLAGITLKDPALYQIAGAEDNKNIQQEKQ
jgi:hypothetical protein